MSLEFYEEIIENTKFTVPNRYKNLSDLGSGTFGSVCYALDTVRNRHVSIKKLSRCFESTEIGKRVIREVRLLKHVNHENIIKLYDIFINTTNPDDLNDVYLVYSFMEMTLHTLLYKQPERRTLSDEIISKLSYQMLRGLHYLHSCGIIHRDIKPCNLILNQEFDLKIIDFGLARHDNTENNVGMTGYVTTRWYRAPEVILTWMGYTKAIDNWAAGCVIVEMYLRKAIFGAPDKIQHLNVILKKVGPPSPNYLETIDKDAREYIQKNLQNLPATTTLDEDLAPIQSHLAIDLIKQFFVLTPEQRLTSTMALRHPFFVNSYEQKDETPGEPFVPVCEDAEHTVEEWRRYTYNEIIEFQNRATTATDMDEDQALNQT